ncbi:DUF3488 and transglutaminase-like domain-containing protein [Reinekea marina]|uniref:TransglutaminaseTgpA domain-containing protein n=1 Tax=Reinekea marina TaxID=1310421 RepID=A0ABV7WW44_9GAMM|nr:DUF3488 and transglutaminase-like domain-containing protein [Reinekea marina]MDN3648933.1 DUF3488 and transglutaminase-like domain-containing protein [Reinekea marina]
MNNQAYIAPSMRALSRQALQILFVVQFITVLPFLADLPKWLLLVLALVVGWRWQVMHGRMQRPPRLLVLTAIVAGLASLYLSGLDQYSLDTAVALCLLGYLLKSLEVLRRRDGVFQIYLGLFLAGVYFLYHSSPLSMLLVTLLLFANLLALQAVTCHADFSWRYALRQSTVIVVAAIPVMVLGYLFFPRIPPLWSIPNNERGSVTGMTDSITPGEIAELARSEKPAFRVNFEGDVPPKNLWYWRGNTLSEFDGRSWTAKYRAGSWLGSVDSETSLPQAQESSWDYSIIIEPTRQQWLYFMDWPTQASVNNGVLLPDARYALTAPLTQAIQYKASSAQEVSWPALSNFERQEYVRLPSQGNEALRRWALSFREGRSDNAKFMVDLADYIRSNPYFYSLTPPQYVASDSLADFWLLGKRGFCSHYASATAYILRAVGIPTRLVGGYLGGVYNESANYIQVRQMEAHVWVEVWLNGGWVRFDPTAAVAPNRVEQSLDDLLAEDQASELPIFSRMRNQLSMLKSASLWWDSVQYQWQIMVLDYKSTQAIGWFESHFGRLTPWKAAMAIIIFMALISLLMAFSLGLLVIPRRRAEPYRSLAKIEKILGKREPDETIRQYFDRMSKNNDNLTILISLAGLFERYLYSSKPKNLKLIRHSVFSLQKQKNR